MRIPQSDCDYDVADRPHEKQCESYDRSYEHAQLQFYDAS